MGKSPDISQSPLDGERIRPGENHSSVEQDVSQEWSMGFPRLGVCLRPGWSVLTQSQFGSCIFWPCDL